MSLYLFILVFMHRSVLSDSNMFEVRLVPEAGAPPAPRYGAVFVPILDDDSYYGVLIGGIDEKKRYRTEVFRYSKDRGWILIPICSTQKFPPRIKFAFGIFVNILYVWGGSGPDGIYNDLYSMNLHHHSTFSIYAEPQSIFKPPPTSDPGFAWHGKYLYIFGGRTQDGITNEMYRLDFTTKEWEQFDVSDSTPTPRCGAQMTYYEGYLFLFGGQIGPDCDPDPKNIIYRAKVPDNEPANGTSLIWEAIPMRSMYDETDVAISRFDAGFAWLGNVVMFVGGRFVDKDGNLQPTLSGVILYLTEAVSDTEGNIVTFEQGYVSSNTVTTDLLYPAGIVLREPNPDYPDNQNQPTIPVIYVFGGISNDKVNGRLFQLGIGETTGIELSTITDVIEKAPSPRAYQASCYSLGRMWIFGGIGPSDNSLVSITASLDAVYFNDLYSFDLFNEQWTAIEPTGEHKPEARAYTCLCEDGGLLILFGGIGMDSITGESSVMNDIWRYSISSNAWKELTPTNGSVAENTLPPARYKAGSVMIHHNLFVFGGASSRASPLNDLWKFSGITLKWTKCKLRYYQSSTQDTTDSVLDPRIQPTLFTRTTQLDGVKREVLIIAGGLTAAGDPIDKPQVLVLPKDDSYNQDEFTVEYLGGVQSPTLKPRDHAIFEDSCVVPYEHGIMSLYGLHSDLVVGDRNVIDFSNVKAPVVSSHTQDISHRFAPFGGSCIYYGRHVYYFGGKTSYAKIPSHHAFTSDLYKFPVTSEYSCSPGTYNSSGVCKPAEPGKYAPSYNMTEPRRCQPGFVNPHYGASNADHCVLCNAGSYTSLEGTSECQPCEQNDYCPPGSTIHSLTQPYALPSSNIEHQPELRRNYDKLSLVITVICYVIPIVVGALVALIAFRLPTRKYLRRMDFFSSEKYVELDEEHQKKKIPVSSAKTLFGGFLMCVCIPLIFGAIVNVIIDWILNNINETKSLLLHVTDQSYDISHLNVPSLQASLELIGYNGLCTAGSNPYNPSLSSCHASLHVKVSGILDRRNATLTPQCQYIDGSPSSCNIVLFGVSSSLNFTKNLHPVTISISNLNTTVYSYAIRSFLSVDTGIKKEENVKPISSKELIYVDPNDLLLKGSQPTIMQYRVMGSFFRDRWSDKMDSGAQIILWNTTGGSTTDGNEATIQYGLNAVLEIVPDEQVIYTQWVRRQTIPTQISNVVSPFANFFKIFGGIAAGAAMILGLNLSIVRKIKTLPFLSALFADYNEDAEGPEDEPNTDVSTSSSSTEMSSIPDSSLVSEINDSIPSVEEGGDEEKTDTSNSSTLDNPPISEASSIPETDNSIPSIEEVTETSE